MKLTRCSYNHFYDGEKYDVCPHCKGQGNIVDSERGTVQLKQEPSVQPKENGDRALFFQKYFSGKSKQSKEKSVEEETVSLQQRMKSEMHMVNPRETSMLQPEQGTMELQSVINQAKASSPYEESKTMGFYQTKASEPVVGWLVFIKGEYVGESFSLKAGRNNVGRSLKMDVALAKDLSVSRERHMVLTYEPKKRKFYLQPGESNGLTYVNDELLLVPCELNGHEEIQIGNDSKCIFIPLCGENFTWEDYI